MPDERLITAKEKPDDKNLDLTLRPRELVEYFGQQKIKDNLEIFMKAAKQKSQLNTFYYMARQV